MSYEKPEEAEGSLGCAVTLFGGLAVGLLGVWAGYLWSVAVRGETAGAWDWVVLVAFLPPGLFFAWVAVMLVYRHLRPPRSSEPAAADVEEWLLDRPMLIVQDGQPPVPIGTLREFDRWADRFASPDELARFLGRLTEPVDTRRPLPYTFAHQTLPAKVFENHPELIRDLTTERPPRTGLLADLPDDRLLHMWSHATIQVEAAGIETDDDALSDELGRCVGQTTVTPVRRDGWTLYVVGLPSAEHPREAHFAGILHHDADPHEYMQPSPRTRYFVLEVATEIDGTYLCEWFADRKRENYGIGPRAAPHLFADAVFARVLGPSTVAPAGTPAPADGPGRTVEQAVADQPPAGPERTAVQVGGPPPADPTAVPTAIPGYSDVTEVARGGMGVVLYARERALGREVAIKLPLLDPARREAVLARFRREAEITARLPHPGIPPVYALGELDDGRPFLALKFVRGRTLAGLLAARPPAAGDWADRWERVAIELCRTVGVAHQVGIVHRDLKPGNVMVGQFDEVQVMDWGLAKWVGHPDAPPSAASADPADGLTVAGSVLGTPAYMAPEQARGEPADARTDVFALGAVFCELATGSPPYGHGLVSELLARAAGGVLAAAHVRVRAAGLPPDVAELIVRCLSADPAGRPNTATAVAYDLTALRDRRQEADRTERLAAANTEAERIKTDARERMNRKERRADRAIERRFNGAYYLGGIGLACLVGLVKIGCSQMRSPSSDYSYTPPRTEGTGGPRVFTPPADAVSPIELLVPDAPPDPNRAAAARSQAAQLSPTAAATEYFRAVRADPTNADGLSGLAEALTASNRPQLAIGYAKRAAELAPKEPVHRRRLGLALLAAEDHREAERVLRTVVADDRKDVDAHQGLAAALAADGRWAEAVEIARAAVRANRAEAVRPARGLRRQTAVWAVRAVGRPAAAAVAGPAVAAADRRFRALAVNELIADHNGWVAAVSNGTATRRAFADVVANWKVEPAFAPYRSAAALPADERERWASFWAAVDARHRELAPADSFTPRTPRR